MFFRNLTSYRLDTQWASGITAEQINEILKSKGFVPSGTHDLSTSGWIAPASHAPDLFAYPCSGAVLVALQTEEKLLPSRVIRKEADKRVAKIEADENRRVGRREVREIRERVAEELVPRAFSDVSVTYALIDLADGWVVVNTGSQSVAEQLLSKLRDTLGQLPTRLPDTKMAPSTAMSVWLQDGAPEGFALDVDAHMAMPGEGGANVTVKRHDLSADTVKQHLQSGMLATKLGLSWAERIAFILTEKLQLTRLVFLDLINEEVESADADDAAQLFDVRLTLMVLESRKLLAAIMQALGGEQGK